MKVETLTERLLFSTAYIQTATAEGATIGTGFLYVVETSKGTMPLLVTNKHVLEGAREIQVRLIRATPAREPMLGVAATATIRGHAAASWVGHPDPEVDVAVLPVASVLDSMQSTGQPPYVNPLSSGIAMNEAVAQTLEAIQEVIFIGYPAGLFDTRNLLPIARRGSTATPPSVDYRGEPAFLIDAAVFQGSSGSPVLIAQEGIHPLRGGGIETGTQVILLGVLASVHARVVEAEVEVLPTKLGTVVKDPINLGIVYKAAAIEQCADLVIESIGAERAAAWTLPSGASLASTRS